MRRLGRYEIVDELGRGGAAVVYLARDTATDRAVAVKVLAPHLPRQGDAQARFEREIKLAVQLEHPNIIPIFDVGIEGDEPYIVLRLMSGGSLADRLQQGPMSLPAALAILTQVASALDAAHRLNIIHRDIKPSNILFDQGGTAYLADFGIAKAIDAVTPVTTSGIVGTPAFMSPEQLRGQPIDGRTDGYALGIVAFVMLTGRLPYDGTTAHIITQHLLEPLPDARSFNPQLPPPIQATLERATAKDPALRYTSAGEFVAALGDAAEGWLSLGGLTPVLEAADLAPVQAPAQAGPGAGMPRPESAAALSSPPAPLEPSSVSPDMATRAGRSISVPAALAQAPRSARVERRPRGRWLLAVLSLLVAVALLAGWQLGAFPGATRPDPSPTGIGALALCGLTSTAAAANAVTTATSISGVDASVVTLAPDAIGLAVITLPPGSVGAALKSSPTGDACMSLPSHTIVQVLRGRQRLSDDSVWVAVRLLSGETGWVAEALLTYLNQPLATPTAGATTQTPPTPLPVGATQRPTAPATVGPATAGAQPTTAYTPTFSPAATTQPSPASTSPAAVPTQTLVPPTQPSTATRALPTDTAPAPTTTPVPSKTPMPTDTPTPTNTPILVLPTLPLPTLPVPTLPVP